MTVKKSLHDPNRFMEILLMSFLQSSRLIRTGTLLLTCLIMGCLVFLSNAQGQQTGVKVWEICVPDGTCAAAPPAICWPGAIPNQPCQMCSAPKARERCVFSIGDNCAWIEWLGFQGDCGVQWIGACLGGPAACLPPPGPTGRCSRLTCNSVGSPTE